MKKACRATQKEKAQAATLLHWLLTKHRCVKAVSISEDIFSGQEDVVRSALSGSVGVTVVELLAFSSWELLSEAVITSLNSMRQLKRVNVVIDAPGALFADLAPLIKTSCYVDVLRAIHVNTRMNSRGVRGTFEEWCEKKLLCSVSITALIVPELRGRSRANLGSAAFSWRTDQSLTALKVIASKRGPNVDVRAICEAVSANPVLTQLDLELLTLKEEHAAFVKTMMASSNTLKHFGLTYNDADSFYCESYSQRGLDSLLPQFNCVRCKTIHVPETPRIKLWIEALLQANRSVTELRFSMFAFCTLECRAFLNALSKNSTLKMVTIPVLGQHASEFCKCIKMSKVMRRVTTDILCEVAYPFPLLAPPRNRGSLVPVVFCNLESTLSDVSACQLVTHVQLRVHSFLCLCEKTDATASPLVQLIRRAPALETLVVFVERDCCSECWNAMSRPLCDAVLHNTAIRTLEMNFPKNPAMRLLPLADLLHRNPGLSRFALKAPGNDAFAKFLRHVSKPKLWDNYNLAFVDLRDNGRGLLKEKLMIQSVVDRNLNLATRAARFVGGMRNKDGAEALEKMSGSALLVQKVCDVLRLKKDQALDRITQCLKEIGHMEEFWRLTGVVRNELVCRDSVGGTTQLTDLNAECLRRIRQYLKISDVAESTM
ncbi:hypothetical protein MTO96_014772 [Rhipicephalus appendiculatus]